MPWSQDPPSPGSVSEIVERVKVIMDLGFDEGMKALGLPNPRCEDRVTLNLFCLRFTDICIVYLCIVYFLIYYIHFYIHILYILILFT